jgi:phosphonate transport system ATP-binding protein
MEGGMSAAIEVRSATKTFGTRTALQDVNLRVAQGEFTALIGPSGSGKSTLLRAIARLAQLDPGAELRTLGAVVEADDRSLRRRIGFVAQASNLVGPLTLYSNVAMGGLGAVPLWRGLVGAWPKDLEARVDAALTRVGLADFAGARARTLSGGQQQRGAVARALVQGAELLLADEPIAALDPVSGNRVMALLSDINEKEGVTIVVSLHHIPVAQRWCRRIVALKDGAIAFDGPASSLSLAALRDIYGPEIEDAL